MKTTLTILQQKLHQFASPSGIRPALNCVLFNGVRAVATDSFRLVEVTKTTTTGEAIADTLITRDSLKAIKITKADLVIDIDDEAPSGEFLATLPSQKNRPYPLDVCANDDMATPNGDRFPLYEKIKEEAAAREYVEVDISGEYLAEIAAYLAKFQQGRQKGAIKLRVPLEKNQPIIMEARSTTEKAYALLMPLQAV